MLKDEVEAVIVEENKNTATVHYVLEPERKDVWYNPDELTMEEYQRIVDNEKEEKFEFLK